MASKTSGSVRSKKSRSAAPAPDVIHIKGARSNNLQNVEIQLPKEKLIVVCGLSGSGKSSLIMDTLYAEGQRRYVESLSSYARQFMERMKKPDVDYIRGLCPAIAIEQRTAGSNARSTVGSVTEIYDYLRLLFARAGKTISPISGEEVMRYQTSDVVDYILSLDEKSRVVLTAPLIRSEGRTLEQELKILIQKGFTRVMQDEEPHYIEDLLEDKKIKGGKSGHSELRIVVDRFVVKKGDEELKMRMGDSVQTAFLQGGGSCRVEELKGENRDFNNRFEADGITFMDPTPNLFNYNNAYGACSRCEGYGQVLGIDENKVIPNPGLSVLDGAIACYSGQKSDAFLQAVLDNAYKYKLRVTVPYRDLSESERDLLWEGSRDFPGINDYFERVEKKSYKIQNRVLLSRYRGRTRCPECKGKRLKKEALYVKYCGVDIGHLMQLPVDELLQFFEENKPDKHRQKIASRLLVEIETRLRTMVKTGLEYLTLNRISSTLSGGELQRINLTRLLSSNLTKSLYILDEPSIGLHPRDSRNLLKVLKDLRDLNNTVVVVEHEEDIIREADHIVEIGPGAGLHGGKVVFSDGSKRFFDKKNNTITSDYLSGKKRVSMPGLRRKLKYFLELEEARCHNIEGIDIKIPLHVLTVVTGVSGSGKSTLVRDILYPAVQSQVGDHYVHTADKFKSLGGDLDRIEQVEWVSQKPIGRSSRSNPVTYVKAYDEIRKLMASRPFSEMQGFMPRHFSFNVEGGRCPECEGEGKVTIEMQFLADVSLVCEACRGMRFKHEVLQVKYRDKNIHDILEMSVEESLEYFAEEPQIARRLQALYDVGLGYIKLGQSSSTLSGGEAQRVKLASFLLAGHNNPKTLFIFDEPTTGLHFDDINKLLTAIAELIGKGHTAIIIEHNMEVIKSADWIIDLGPDGGKKGGQVVYQGPRDGILEVKESHTGQFLAKKLESEAL